MADCLHLSFLAEMKFKQHDRKKRIRSVPSYLLLFSTENDKVRALVGIGSNL